MFLFFILSQLCNFIIILFIIIHENSQKSPMLSVVLASLVPLVYKRSDNILQIFNHSRFISPVIFWMCDMKIVRKFLSQLCNFIIILFIIIVFVCLSSILLFTSSFLFLSYICWFYDGTQLIYSGKQISVTLNTNFRTIFISHIQKIKIHSW
jgi:hypothetical protein